MGGQYANLEKLPVLSAIFASNGDAINAIKGFVHYLEAATEDDSNFITIKPKDNNINWVIKTARYSFYNGYGIDLFPILSEELVRYNIGVDVAEMRGRGESDSVSRNAMLDMACGFAGSRPMELIFNIGHIEDDYLRAKVGCSVYHLCVAKKELKPGELALILEHMDVKEINSRKDYDVPDDVRRFLLDYKEMFEDFRRTNGVVDRNKLQSFGERVNAICVKLHI